MRYPLKAFPSVSTRGVQSAHVIELDTGFELSLRIGVQQAEVCTFY